MNGRKRGQAARHSTRPTGDISSVSYGILSAEAIEQRSVVQIKTTSLYCRGEPVANGLHDVRLGTNDPGVQCGTCSEGLHACPGHTGHLVLAMPVVNVEFLSSVLKILSCVCYHCSRLLIASDPAKMARVRIKSSRKERNAAVVAACKSVRVCRDAAAVSAGAVHRPNRNGDPCGGVQPRYSRHPVDPVIQVTFDGEDAMRDTTPDKIALILGSIDDATIELLGFSVQWARPLSMLWTNFLIPPVIIRPRQPKATGRGHVENDCTTRLKSIVKLNEVLAAASAVEAPDTPSLSSEVVDPVLPTDQSSAPESPEGNTDKCSPNLRLVTLRPQPDETPGPATRAYFELQRAIATYQNNAKSVDRRVREYGKAKESIRTRFQGSVGGGGAKSGRLRRTVFGKRLNSSARSVIVPCNEMSLDDIGVPEWMCRRLTRAVRVTAYNLSSLTRAVEAGPDVYPGAVYVVNVDGRTIDLRRSQDRPGLALGMLVHRHLIAGDRVFVNRQPSLHKQSVLGLRVRVVPGYAFRINVAITPCLNADFDGDEIHVFPANALHTVAEMDEILHVRNNMAKDGRMIVQCVQHTVLAVYMLSDPTRQYGRDVVFNCYMQMACAHPHLHIPLPDGCGDEYPQIKARRWSGTEILSLCLSSDLYLDTGRIRVVAGRIVSTTRITKDILNRDLVFAVWKDFGSNAACVLIDRYQQMSDWYLAHYGASISYDDCVCETPAHLAAQVKALETYVDSARFRAHTPEGGDQVTEAHLAEMVDACRTLLGNHAVASAKADNGLTTIISSGAKGSTSNIIQIRGRVGQQLDYFSRRIRKPLSVFNDPLLSRAQAFGDVRRSFTSGLDGPGFFMHMMGTRDGLIDTGTKTAVTGYVQRKLVKGLEDSIAQHCGNVTHQNTAVVQRLYGGDGFGSERLEKVSLRLAERGASEMTYLCHPDDEVAFARLTPEAYARWCSQPTVHHAELGVLAGMISVLQREQTPTSVDSPVAYPRLQLALHARRVHPAGKTDLTPYELYHTVRETWRTLIAEGVLPNNALILHAHALFLDWCSTYTLWSIYSVDSHALVWLLRQVRRHFALARVDAGESVGSLAAQNCTEPVIQMTLNRFHIAGQASHVGGGLTQIRDIMGVTRNLSVPRMRARLRGDVTPAVAAAFVAKAPRLLLRQLVIACTDLPVNSNRRDSFKSCWNKWKCPGRTHTLTLLLRKHSVYSPRMVCRKLLETMLIGGSYGDPCPSSASDSSASTSTPASSSSHDSGVTSRSPQGGTWDKRIDNPAASFAYSEVRDAEWWISITVSESDGIFSNSPSTFSVIEMYHKHFAHMVIGGIEGVTGAWVTPATTTTVDLAGSNLLQMMTMPCVERDSVTTNHLWQVYETLGIDATAYAIHQAWSAIVIENGLSISARHILLISDVMCTSGVPAPMTYQGMLSENASATKMAAFEKAVDTFVWAASHGHRDDMSGSASSVCWNGLLRRGTGAVTLLEEEVRPNLSVELDLMDKYIRSQRNVQAEKLERQQRAGRSTTDMAAACVDTTAPVEPRFTSGRRPFTPWSAASTISPEALDFRARIKKRFP